MHSIPLMLPLSLYLFLSLRHSRIFFCHTPALFPSLHFSFLPPHSVLLPPLLASFLKSIISYKKRQACWLRGSVLSNRPRCGSQEGKSYSQSIRWCFSMGAVGCRHTWEREGDNECEIQRERGGETGGEVKHTLLYCSVHEKALSCISNKFQLL